MTKSTGDQLSDLRDSLQEKSDKLTEKIDADEEIKASLLKELKAITGKLEEVDGRLGKMKTARKEYNKTIQEVDFALNKIEETATQMAERFGKLSKVQVSI